MYCESNYKNECTDCYLVNYGLDCRNNHIGAGGHSLERDRAETQERIANGQTSDRYGNRYITQAEYDEFMC